MSIQDERRAAELLDEYIEQSLSGDIPSVAVFLNRCPRGEVEDLEMALSGAELILSSKRYARPKDAVSRSFAEVQAMMERRQALLRVRRRFEEHSRAGSISLSRPEEFLSDVMGFGEARNTYSATPTPTAMVMNRGEGPAGPHAARRISEQLTRLYERRARDEAEAVLQRCLGAADETTPGAADEAAVDVDRVAERLFLFVEEVHLEGIDGCLVTDGEAGGILLNRGVANRQRRRFTLAHEIGHFVLHRQKQWSFRDAFDPSSECFERRKAEMEVQANAFASILLLPDGRMPKNFGQKRPTLRQADFLAGRFDVSLPAALWRLVRASSWRCALAVTRHSKLVWSVCSPELDGYVLPSPHFATAACNLADPGEATATLPAAAWLERPVEEEGEELRLTEQSRRLEGGFVYSLLTIQEHDHTGA